MKQALFLLILSAAAFADMISLLSAEKLYGEIIRETDTSVILDGASGEVEYYLDSISEFVLDEKKLAGKVRLGLFQGDAALYREDEKENLEYGMRVQDGDLIVTGPDGLVELFVYKNDLIRIQPNTAFIVKRFLVNERDKVFERKFLLRGGRILCYIRDDYRELKPIEIETPGAAISATASMLGIWYADTLKTTVVDVTDRKGTVGFRPTRMEIGQVVLRDNERAILNERAGNISEDALPEPILNALLTSEAELDRKNVRSIKYPKKPLPKKWIWGGSGVLALAGGTIAVLYLTRPEPVPEKTTSVKVTW